MLSVGLQNFICCAVEVDIKGGFYTDLALAIESFLLASASSIMARSAMSSIKSSRRSILPMRIESQLCDLYVGQIGCPCTAIALCNVARAPEINSSSIFGAHSKHTFN